MFLGGSARVRRGEMMSSRDLALFQAEPEDHRHSLPDAHTTGAVDMDASHREYAARCGTAEPDIR